MVNKFDKIIISILFLFVVFTSIYYFINNAFISLSITLLIYIISVMFYKIKKKYAKNNMTLQEFNDYLSIKGKDFTINFIYNLIKNDNKKLKNDYIEINNYIVIPLIKFGNVSKENIAKIYNITKDNKYEKSIVIYSNIDKNTMIFINNLDVKIELISINKIYNYLKKNNNLPKKPEQIMVNKSNYKILFSNLMNEKTSKKITLIGIVIILISYITPLKLYYIITGSIVILIGIIPLIIKKIIDNK